MGCRVSKVDDLPLVIRCRERKRLIKSAVDYRYELSCAHLAYFHSLKDVGYVLSKFVDEQLVIDSPLGSVSSPVLTLPSELGKSKSKNNNGSESSGSGSVSHLHSIDGGGDNDKGSESELSVSLDGNIHLHDNNDDDDDGGGFRNRPPPYSNVDRPYGYNLNEPYVSNRGPVPYQGPNQTNWGEPYEMNRGPQPYQPRWENLSAFPYQPPWGPNQNSWGDPSASQYQPPWGAYQGDFGYYNGYSGNSDLNANANPNQNFYYMKKSAPASHTVIQQEEARGFQETSQWVDPPVYDPYASGYGHGFGGATSSHQEPEKPKSPPPPPPPMESDYFNFFNAYDNEYQGYGYGYGYETVVSSPDTSEVREREGIPDLEEETETESHYEEAGKMRTFGTKRNLGKRKEDSEGDSWKETSSGTEGSSRRMPPGESEGTSKAAHVESTSNSEPLENKEGAHSVNIEVDKHSSETIVSHSTEEDHEEKKEVNVDIDEGSTHEIESSILSSLTTLSPNGSRDLHEVVHEIKEEFESAFGCGKEVALMLEAGKLPYQSKFAVLKVILSKIIYPLAPSLASSDHSIQSAH